MYAEVQAFLCSRAGYVSHCVMALLNVQGMAFWYSWTKNDLEHLCSQHLGVYKRFPKFDLSFSILSPSGSFLQNNKSKSLSFPHVPALYRSPGYLTDSVRATLISEHNLPKGPYYPQS